MFKFLKIIAETFIMSLIIDKITIGNICSSWKYYR